MAWSEIGNGIGVDPWINVAFCVVLGYRSLFGIEFFLGIATAIVEVILIFRDVSRAFPCFGWRGKLTASIVQRQVILCDITSIA